MKAISSDDPLALDKLRAKLAELEKLQDLFKAANKIVRSKLDDPSKVDDLLKLGLKEDHARKLLTPDFCGRLGFPTYELTNNNANMARIRDRITALEKREGLQSSEETFAGVIFRTNIEANRLQIVFPGIPSYAIRQVLKHSAFKWAPSEGAWQRMLPVANYVQDRIKEAIAPKPVHEAVLADPGELAEDRFNDLERLTD